MAKLAAGRLVREVADWCPQFHGGSGYMDENYVSRRWRDSRLLSIGVGAGEVMLQVIANIEGGRGLGVHLETPAVPRDSGFPEIPRGAGAPAHAVSRGSR